MRSIFNYIGKLSLMLSLALYTGACDDPDYPTPDTTANTQARANILAVNTSPGSTPTHFLVDNVEQAILPYNTKLADQPNLNLVNGYLPIFGGQRLLEINNFDPANAAKTIALRQAFNTNSSSTIFLTDAPSRAAAGTDPGGVRYLVLPDNLAGPAAGKAGLRFINVAPGSPSLGLYNTVTQQSLFPTSKTFTSKAGTQGTLNNLQNRSFREVSKTLTISEPAPSTVKETFTESLTNFTNVDPGTYNLDIRTSTTSLPVATKQNVTLEAGKLYTIYVFGLSGNSATPLGFDIIRHN
jgi:hypothetical protein